MNPAEKEEHMTAKNEKFEVPAPTRMSRKMLSTLEVIVRLLGLVNGTITIHTRGGKLCRAVEIVNRIDVVGFE